MTVRELLEVHIGALYITSEGDPFRDDIELKIQTAETDESECLSDKVLDSEIHLMTVREGKLTISLFWNK